MQPTPAKPADDLKTVVESQIKEFHFHIYFHQMNVEETAAALQLRDAILRLRHEGAFVAVPLAIVNSSPLGPHPVGSYEVWVPKESFVEVYSYVIQNRGGLSVLVHPLTRDELDDHCTRTAWIGPSFPLDLSMLPVLRDDIPLQYPRLQTGWSSQEPDITLEERRKKGQAIEDILATEDNAAKAP